MDGWMKWMDVEGVSGVEERGGEGLKVTEKRTMSLAQCFLIAIT